MGRNEEKEGYDMSGLPQIPENGADGDTKKAAVETPETENSEAWQKKTTEDEGRGNKTEEPGEQDEDQRKEPDEPQEKAQEKTEPTRDRSTSGWTRSMGWRYNPFTFSINASLFVGYSDQTDRLFDSMQERQKVMLILGPTGSGKTTLLNLISEKENSDFLYLAKPPERPEEFVEIFNEKYGRPWPLRWFISNIKNKYQIDGFLNKRLGDRHLVVLCDEAHESGKDVLEWLRVLADQVRNMSLVLSALPAFEDQLKDKLETLHKRITTKIELVSLTKEETKELIEKRIMSVGGSGDEFTEGSIDAIYQRTGGFPREVIRTCNDMIHKAAEAGMNKVTENALSPKESKPSPSLRIMDELTPMQRTVVESLTMPKTPGDLADELDLSKYKSRQHAVRSINNVLKQLMDMDMVERRREDRAYVYSLTPQIKNILVRA